MSVTPQQMTPLQRKAEELSILFKEMHEWLGDRNEASSVGVLFGLVYKERMEETFYAIPSRLEERSGTGTKTYHKDIAIGTKLADLMDAWSEYQAKKQATRESEG